MVSILERTLTHMDVKVQTVQTVQTPKVEIPRGHRVQMIQISSNCLLLDRLCQIHPDPRLTTLGLEADAISFNALISACEKCRRWEEALLFLDLAGDVADDPGRNRIRFLNNSIRDGWTLKVDSFF